MAISLKKGQGISLSKSEFDLSKVSIGLGWDIASSGGFLKSVFGKKVSVNFCGNYRIFFGRIFWKIGVFPCENLSISKL